MRYEEVFFWVERTACFGHWGKEIKYAQGPLNSFFTESKVFKKEEWTAVPTGNRVLSRYSYANIHSELPKNGKEH